MMAGVLVEQRSCHGAASTCSGPEYKWNSVNESGAGVLHELERGYISNGAGTVMTVSRAKRLAADAWTQQCLGLTAELPD